MSTAMLAQSISITAPTANQVLTGFSGFSFAVSVSSLPAAARVCYTVDAYPAQTTPCSLTPGWSVPWNSFNVLNGAHQVVATAFDILGNTLATSSPVAFTTANTWPAPYAPGMTVATGTPLTSNWSGFVSITPTISGSGSGDSKTFNYWIDGVYQTSVSTSSASQAFSVNTTRFPNGPHIVAVTMSVSNADGTCYSNGPCQNMAAEWSRTVTFANSSSPMELRADAREVFLQPTQTHQIVGTLVNDDGTTSNPTLYYYSANTSVCTVSSSGLVTAVANGACQVSVMASQVTGTDLQITGTGTNPTFVVALSNAHPFSYDTGQLFEVTGGSGWTPGPYLLKNWNFNSGATPSLTLFGSPAANGATGGSFATGSTRVIWFYVWTDNVMPHFGLDGSVLSSFNASKSYFMGGSFSSGATLANDVPYSPGVVADMASGGYNVIETGMDSSGLDVTGASGQTSFQSSQAAYVAQYQGLVAGTKLRFSLTGDNFLNDLQNFWYYVSGTTSTWSPTGLHTLFSSWAGQSNPAIWASMKDEVQGTYQVKPLQGPIIFNGGIQSGLTSIVASGGTCTANWTGWSFNGVNRFIIRNATTSGFNSAAGTTYTATKVDANTYTFSCPSVANGTYNSSTDATLAIEPLAIAWYNGNTDYLHYNAFAQLRTIRAGAGNLPMSFPNAAGTTLQSVTNWSGNGTQSIGGVAQVADVNDLYWTHIGPEAYLASWSSTNNIISEQGDNQIRPEYGSFNPDNPTLIQTQGVVSNYGFEGYSVAVSSCSGNTITTASAHNLKTVLPGITRLWVTGNAGCNGNYYVLSIPDGTHLTVALATPTFSLSGTGGTLTFSNDSYTKTINTISTTAGLNGCSGSGGTPAGGVLCGPSFSYTGAVDPLVNTHIGQQFTVSGNSQANFNSNTFVYDSENVSVATTGDNYFRQIPSLSGSGGTVTIVADNFYVRGRNGEEQNDNQIGWNFSTVIEAAMLRAAGTRLYKDTSSFSAWSSSYGFGGQWGLNRIFQDTSAQSVQLFSNPHWENYNSVPSWHSTSLANMLIQRLGKYYLQPALNSPDYGPAFEACAHGGSYGNMLMVSNFTDGPQVRTINLTPYLEAGQQIVKMYVNPLGMWTVTSLNAGTSSDTVTFDANGVVVYLFPVAYASELEVPIIGVSLADVSGATKLSVRFGYDRYLLDSSANMFGCASVPCSLPADRNIGAIYYRVIFTDNTNKVLATSDVQTM